MQKLKLMHLKKMQSMVTLNAVVSKICVGIVAKQKERREKVAEQNSAKDDNEVEDIFQR